MLFRLHVFLNSALFPSECLLASIASYLSTNTLEMLSRKFFNPVPNRRFGVGILMLSTSFVLTTVHNYFPPSGNRSLFRLHERSSPANCSFKGVSISSSSEDNVASAILFTHSPQATPTSFPGLFPSRGGRPHENGKALGTRLRLRPHDTHSKGKNMSFTRKMFRILTKRILTCLFKKKKG